MTSITTFSNVLMPYGSFHENNGTKLLTGSSMSTWRHCNIETESSSSCANESSSSNSMMSKSDFDYEDQSAFTSGCITDAGEKLFL